MQRQPSYAIPVRRDFSCWTNSDLSEELSFQHGQNYLDLTGHSFLATVRSSESGDILETFSTVGSAIEGFYPVEPDGGFIQFRVDHETLTAIFDAVSPLSLVGDQISLPLDILVTFPSGDQEAWLYGFFNLTKGISNG